WRGQLPVDYRWNGGQIESTIGGKPAPDEYVKLAPGGIAKFRFPLRGAVDSGSVAYRLQLMVSVDGNGCRSTSCEAATVRLKETPDGAVAAEAGEALPAELGCSAKPLQCILSSRDAARPHERLDSMAPPAPFSPPGWSP